MRTLYWDEAPIDTLLQIEKGPVADGNLISKTHRSEFFRLGWVARCEGWNIITPRGREVIHALRLSRFPENVNSVGHADGCFMAGEAVSGQARDGDTADIAAAIRARGQTT